MTAPGSGTGRRPSRGLGWPIGMAVILAITVSANLYVYHLANDDPSFAVEPDYYQKAVHWDDELAQRRHNAELGWRATTALTAAADGGAELRVRLTDSAGAPLAGATVRVEAFAIDRASQVATLTLAADTGSDAGSDAGGAYAARLSVARRGRWELRLEAVRGAERFTSVERVESMP